MQEEKPIFNKMTLGELKAKLHGYDDNLIVTFEASEYGRDFLLESNSYENVGTIEKLSNWLSINIKR